jgi:hypothetical protein
VPVTRNVHGRTPDAEGASLAAPGNVWAFTEVSSPRSAERNMAFAIFAERNR